MLKFIIVFSGLAKLKCLSHFYVSLKSRVSPCKGEGWGPLLPDRDNPHLQNGCVQTLITTPSIID